MKIHIKTGKVCFTLPIPTALVFSKSAALIAARVMKPGGNASIPEIPPASMERLFAEFRRIKRRHGHWTFVEVRSADGEEVTVTL